MTEANPCPLCGQPLYSWIALPPPSADASIGMRLAESDPAERVIDRCESCGVAVDHGWDVDLAAEWDAVQAPSENGRPSISVPNRASLQAAIGVQGWAAIDLSPGHLLLTPRSLELLAERNEARLEPLRWAPWGRQQAWMWQTLLNGLTFHPNFARDVRAGRLRPANARSRLAFAVDSVVTVLGAPLIALLSVPLEAVASLLRRGGQLRTRPH